MKPISTTAGATSAFLPSGSLYAKDRCRGLCDEQQLEVFNLNRVSWDLTFEAW